MRRDDTLPGLSYHGVEPDPRLDRWAADGRALWSRFEITLSPRMRGLLDTPADPWRDRSATSRAGAVGLLAETFRDLAGDRRDAVLAGALDLPGWRDALLIAGHPMLAAAALIQHGGDAFADELTRRRVSEAAAQLELRLDELARRAGLDPDQPDAISLAQAAAWGGQSGRGLIRASGQMAAAARFEGQPVSRIMTAFEDHCATCPGKARLYASVEAMVRECGGWPGDGSDECHGNCLCGLEPATEYSVYGDTTEGLLTPTGPDWTP